VHEESGQPAAWFAEGLTVHYARRLLFDAGMIEAADVAADLNRIEDEASGPRGEEREAYRRGSRYAALLEHRIRKASRGARSLDDLLAALRARGAGPRPVGDFRAAVVAELGEEAGAEFDRLVVRREDEIDLPGEAFGPCLRPRREQRKVFDLGFRSPPLDAGPVVIRGLKSRSAAAKAGLREGALVLQIRSMPSPEDGPESEVDMTVADRSGAKRVRYKPMAVRSVARWQTRACKASAGR
jgi:predicted metalloprotease with PDZ domain